MSVRNSTAAMDIDAHWSGLRQGARTLKCVSPQGSPAHTRGGRQKIGKSIFRETHITGFSITLVVRTVCILLF